MGVAHAAGFFSEAIGLSKLTPHIRLHKARVGCGGSLFENGKRPRWAMVRFGPGRAAHIPVIPSRTSQGPISKASSARLTRDFVSSLLSALRFRKETPAPNPGAVSKFPVRSNWPPLRQAAPLTAGCRFRPSGFAACILAPASVSCLEGHVRTYSDSPPQGTG